MEAYNEHNLTSHSAVYDTVDEIIRTRNTEKVISQTAIFPNQQFRDEIAATDQQVKDSVAVAGWAPFHYDRALEQVAEPWRMQILFHESCRVLSAEFTSLVPNLKPGNKLPGMLNACGALVLVQCLPQTTLEDSSKLDQVNREHHAATSAAVQNLMLALHARQLGTYWSSGGPLGSTEVHQRLGISGQQDLVAAVFVDYPFLTADADVQRIVGKNRSRRSSSEKWSTEISITSNDRKTDS